MIQKYSRQRSQRARRMIRSQIIVLTALAIASAFATSLKPPAIQTDLVDVEVIAFQVWSRNGGIRFDDLDASVIAFTSNEIKTKFLADPVRYADRFYPVNHSNYRELVEFYLLYESYRPPGPQAPECANTWHYSLAVAEVPNGKRFSITRLIFNDSGEVVFGLNISPYAWPETGCPLASQ